MRRILVVDERSAYLPRHSSVAPALWLQGSHRRWRHHRPVALDSSTFDLMIVDIFHARHARFRIDQGISQSRTHGTADRDFRIRILQSEASSPDFLRMRSSSARHVACAKPFRPTTLLSVIDECLSEAEPHRRYVATLAAVASAVSESQEKMPLSVRSREGVSANTGFQPSPLSDAVCEKNRQLKAPQYSSALCHADMAEFLIQIQNGEKRLQIRFSFRTVKNRIPKPKERTCHVFSLSTTIQWFAWPLRFISNGTAFTWTIAGPAAKPTSRP